MRNEKTFSPSEFCTSTRFFRSKRREEISLYVSFFMSLCVSLCDLCVSLCVSSSTFCIRCGLYLKLLEQQFILVVVLVAFLFCDENQIVEEEENAIGFLLHKRQ